MEASITGESTACQEERSTLAKSSLTEIPNSEQGRAVEAAVQGLLEFGIGALCGLHPRCVSRALLRSI